ncbi:MAG: FHA domain-containing protein [Kofleriaceae bacterium]
MCGHESPAGSSFCLNCGSSLAQAPAPAQFNPTPGGNPGLPVVCPACRGENPPGMKFCRACGTGLSAAGAPPMGQPPGIGGGAQNMGYGGAMGAPGNPPMQATMIPGGPPPGANPYGAPNPYGGPSANPPNANPYGAPGAYGAPMSPPMGPPPMSPPSAPGGYGAAAPFGAAMTPPAASNSPMYVPTLAQDGPPGSGAGLPPTKASPDMIKCPRCGTSTPVGFAYCQQCGLHMSALQPTDPGANARVRPPTGGSSGPLGGSGGSTGAGAPAFGQANVDGHAMTLATDGGRPSPLASSSPVIRPASSPAPSPSPSAGPAWGAAVLVNRDGSDGQRFPLAGEYCVVGRAGADIAFDDDRFLARQHARFERAGDGTVKIEALDKLNGVFRKADLPVELADGIVVLVGREVLRYEKVDAEEVKVHPLVRHGVALFGSPPREPWGRFVQIIPSGGYRDVRHLAGEEVVLGREEGDIVFRDDAFMSRRHAAVTWDGLKAQITDLGSSNGTFVRITQPTLVKTGDHVRMGDQLLRIEFGK